MKTPIMRDCPWAWVGENTGPDGVFVCTRCGRVAQGKDTYDLEESVPASAVDTDDLICPDFHGDLAEVYQHDKTNSQLHTFT